MSSSSAEANREETWPLVSVIIPTFNYGQYVRRAIESALVQTYHNVEVIVVDDGSTDNTAEILASFRSRIKVIYQKNTGASAARNRGIVEAKGDYIAFLDADDRYCKDNIAKKLTFLRSYPEYKWCYSNWAWMNERGVQIRRGDEPKNTLAHLRVQGDVFLFALKGYLLGTNVFLFDKTVIETVGGFDENLRVLEDYDLYVRIASHFNIGYLDEILCEIYAHPGSLGTGSSKAIVYLSRLHLNRKLKKMYPAQLEAIARHRRPIQADAYRNLAEVALMNGQARRARVLLCASLAEWPWQVGIVSLWYRINRKKRAGAQSGH
ncbi:MAG: glycosyltransferase [Deltaproteobacteria bacterium]|nr:glycosyltransferase [Deltaproteobacteria bacterium]